MASWKRALVAVALAVAAVSTPLLADHCGLSCDAVRAAGTSEPSCHHRAQAAVRLSQAPQRCGHDHAAVAAVSGAPPISPSAHLVAAIVHSIGAQHDPISAFVSARHADTSPPSPFSIALAATLRI